jgi:hypothetical protein
VFLFGAGCGWMGRSAMGCWAERLVVRGWDEILRSAQDDRRDGRVRCGQRGVLGQVLKLGMGPFVLAQGKWDELQWRVEAWKKQVPRSARNDKSRGFQRAVRRVVGLGFVAAARVAMISDRSEDRPLHAERIRH